MVRVGLGESGRLVGGHGLLGAMWRGGLGGRRRVGSGSMAGVEREELSCLLVYLFCMGGA